MNIIFGHAHAEMIRERYTVLEIVNLEDVVTDYQCYCVVEGTKIPVDQLPTLKHYTELHGKLIDNIRKDNRTTIVELAQVLQRHWGGELDSFYETVIEHFK